MSCPAVEHGKAVAASNAKRFAELIDEITHAGMWQQVNELFEISSKPESAFTARMAKQRDERRKLKSVGL